METGMNVRELLLMLRRRWLTLLSTAIVTAGVLLSVVFFGLQPVYEGSTQVILQVEADPAKPASDGASTQLIASYLDIVKGPVVMQEVIEKLQLKTTVLELQQKVVVTNSLNSQIVNITVQDNTSEDVANIIEAVTAAAYTKVQELFKNGKPIVLSGGNPQPEKVFPKEVPVLAIAVVVGVMAGIAMAMLRDHLLGAPAEMKGRRRRNKQASM